MVPKSKGGHKLKIRGAIQSWTPQTAQYGQAPAAAVPAPATAGGWAASAPAPAPYTPPGVVAATGGGWGATTPAPVPYSPPAAATQMPTGGGWGLAPAAYTPPPGTVTQAVVVDSSVTSAAVGMPVAATVIGGNTRSAPGQAAGPTLPPYNAQPQPQAGMCIQCGARPVFTDLRTGQRHQYCGKRCAGDARAGRPPAAAAISAGAGGATAQLGMPPGGAAPMPHHHQPQQPQPQAPMCATCGVKPANPPHPYCGRRCAAGQPVAGGAAGGSVPQTGVLSASIMHPAAAPGMCLFCNKRPAVQGHPFCGRSCANIAQQAG
eukprot:COSAG02_NODE_12934_length_1470_cov_1.657914_2_plen_318_part_01